MAKKKKSIDFADKELFFKIEKEHYRVIRFHPANMTVDVVRFTKGKKKEQVNMPFAHLPKVLKQRINPK